MSDEQRELKQSISEIREWLVEINANQKHQTEMLADFRAQASNAFDKADLAEDTANEAYKMAQDTSHTFEKYVENERVSRRWIVGTLVAIFVSLVPVFDKVYLN